MRSPSLSSGAAADGKSGDALSSALALFARLKNDAPPDADLGIEIATPSGTVVPLRATALVSPTAAVSDFISNNSLSTNVKADIIALVAPRIADAAVNAAREARAAVCALGEALEVARKNARTAEESLLLAAAAAPAAGVASAAAEASSSASALAAIKAEAAAEREAHAAAIARAHVAISSLQSQLQGAVGDAAAARSEAQLLRKNVAAAEASAAAAHEAAVEASRRRAAWERYVDGPLPSAEDARLPPPPPPAAGDDAAAAAVAAAQRAWSLERRDILASANRDRAALIDENRRLRAAVEAAASTSSLVRAGPGAAAPSSSDAFRTSLASYTATAALSRLTERPLSMSALGASRLAALPLQHR
jgi:hypothetical protein